MRLPGGVRFCAARLSGFAVVFLGITLLVQGVVALTPGDPVLALAGEHVSAEERARMEKALGLDRPFLVRWLDSLADLARGDLGTSYSGRDVGAEIASAFPKTLLLAALTMTLSSTLGLAWGISSVLYRGRLLDRLSLATAVVFISAPVFVTGLLLRYVFADLLGWFPPGGFERPVLYFAALPAITLGTRSAAYFARLARSTLLDLALEPWMLAARAKGRSALGAAFFHLLPASSGPLVSILFLDFASYLTGSVITETIFAWPGLGRLALEAVLTRDLPLLQGIVLVMATTYAALGLAADLVRAWLDPRLRGS